jgi:O-antigen/teichoic acid export membrane protein
VGSANVPSRTSATLILLLGRFSGLALLSLTFVLAARELGPAAFGPIAAVAGATNLLLAFADAGLNSVSIRALARTPDDVSEFGRTLPVKLGISIFLTLSWTVVCLTASSFNSSAIVFLPFALFISGRLVLETLLVPIAARNRMGALSLYGLVERALALVVTAILLMVGLKGLALTIGLTAGNMLTLALVVFREGSPVPLRAPKRGDFLSMIRASRSFWAVSLVSQAMGLDATIVTLLAGGEAGGIYGAASRIIGPIGVAASAYAFVIFTSVSSIASSNSVGQHAVVISRSLRRLALAGFVLSIFCILLAPLVVSIALGDAYGGSVSILRVVVLAAALNMINAPMAAALQALGQEAQVARSIAIGVGVGLCGVALGATWGPLEAAGGVVLAQVLIVIGLVRSWRFNIATLHAC